MEMEDKMRMEMEIAEETKIAEKKERKAAEEARIAKETKIIFDLWSKTPHLQQLISHGCLGINTSLSSIVTTFLKKISNETVYAIHSISVKEYGEGNNNQYTYIATNSKVYMLDAGGDMMGNYRILPSTVFNTIVFRIFINP